MYYFSVINVPIKDLKENLSKLSERASKGELIQITKYNSPFMILGPCRPPGLHVGSQIEQGSLKAVLNQGSKGQWLHYLNEDREEK